MARPRVFQIPAILEGISPLKDGGLSLRFHTNEVKEAKDKTKVMNFFNSFGWLQFSDHTINTVPRESAHRESGVKTPSQRLRSVLFILWKQKYADEPFDPWYERQMERIIGRIKEELQ